MTLTEQWKKGELESGWYYVKGADGLIGMMSDYALYRVNLEHPDNEITLLAKMPTYEEWKNVTTCFDYEHKAYLSMVEKNQQLRKWCEEFNALEVANENEALKTKLSIQCEANEELRKACKMRDKIIKKYEDIDDWWKKENQQLKKLLHKCKFDLIGRYTDVGWEDWSLINEIDNAIGEKK